MRCRYCGHDIPDGILYCEQCGKEVRIVPDYNPLDDVLAAQIKGSIDGTERPLDDYEYVTSSVSSRRNTNPGPRSNTNPGSRRNVNSGQRKQTQSQRRNTTAKKRPNTGRMTGNLSEAEQRKRNAAKKRALKKKKRQRAAIIISFSLVLLCILGFILYQNSYSGQNRKGYRALSGREFEKASGYFTNAVKKNPERGEAYTGISKVYIAQNNLTKAEETFLSAIERYPDQAEIYEACILFYMDTDQVTSVSPLLEDAPESVRETLSVYVSDPPEFTLDSSVTYDDVQQLSLTTSGSEIFYTDDGTDPTINSTKYSEPLQIEEGETTISAISVNKKGIPSLPVSETYSVELPIADAPPVTPSTGQYDEETNITITVPEGYVAYYTTDRTNPTAESTRYTGPVSMPEGSTIFKAILIDAKGRTSGITTRNYELTLE